MLVFNLENQILETKLGDETSSELGPLKYLSEVTGKSMDEVMKWFILLLIVIGDPMAVLMVIVFNKVINHNDKDDNPKTKKKIKIKKQKIKHFVKKVNNLMKKYTLSHPNKELNDEPIDLIKPKEVTEIEDEPQVYIEPELIEPELEVPELIEPELTELTEPELTELTEPELTEPELTEPEFEVPDEISVTEIKSNKITLDEIKEVKERDRGFSVKIPSRKNKSNNVSRIGSNKEVRDSDNSTIFFKRRK